ncbi:MAG TPA: non-canonical purine NTP pyrophosphatase [Flavobacteriaceae bacterium]|jgi:XTP/dITP diphosphohydrolase|nr:non-canonical purine NTP pyrophosphatase [Flavobacteriaceae bacterium]
MKLIFATHNPNKLKEVQQLMPNYIHTLGLSDIDCFDDIPETGTTLQENALIKVSYVKYHYNQNCFADDTGLEVEALNGEPGVYSARYAGENNDAELNMQKLLNNLKGKSNRKAQFRTVIALNIKGEQYLFEGICKGEILLNKQGESGFGYDPIFKPEGFDKSFAEMTLEEKGKISHRGIAMAKLIDFLKEIDI